MRHRVAALLCVSGLLIAPAAFAGDAATADALFTQGRAAFDAGDYATACAKFKESNRLDPAAGTVINLATCEEKRGKLATAWTLFRDALGQLQPNDDRYPVVEKSIADLAKRVPHLTLKLAEGAPADTTVKIGDSEYGAASFGAPLPFDPGKLEIVVSAPGHAPDRMKVTLKEGEDRELEVSPEDAGGSGAAHASKTGDATHDHGAGATSGGGHTLAYVLGGIGIGGLVFGGVTGLMARGRHSTVESHCDATSRICDQEGADAADSGRTLNTLTMVGLVIGAAGIGASAYFLLSSDSGGTTAVRAGAGPQAATLSLLRTW